MYRAAPRLATAAISAGAAVTANPPNTAAAEAYRPLESQSDSQIFGRASQNSSRQSILSSGSSGDWDFLVKEDLQSSGCLGPVPTREESEEATRYVLESLHSDPGFVYGAATIFSDPSASASWPEADASMAASEAAMAVARRALLASESSCLTIQGMNAPVASHKSAMGHLRNAFDLLQSSPEDTREVVESLVSDGNVWNAVSQNPAFLSFMAKNSNVRIEEVPETEEEADTETACESPRTTENPGKVNAAKNTAKAQDRQRQSNGFQTFVHNMMVGLGSILNSISGFLAKSFREGKGDTQGGSTMGENESAKEEKGLPASMYSIFLLVILAVAVIIVKRK